MPDLAEKLQGIAAKTTPCAMRESQAGSDAICGLSRAASPFRKPKPEEVAAP